MKLKTKLVLFFTCLSVIAVLMVAVFGYFYMQREITKDINDKYTAIVNTQSNQIDGWIANKIAEVNSVASTFDGINSTKDTLNQKVLIGIFKSINDKDASDLYTGFENGAMYDGSGWNPPKNFDPRIRPWYIAAKDAGKLVITDPYFDMVTKKYALSVAKPMYNTDGSLKGVIAQDLLLSTVTDMVKKLNLGAAGYGMLIDKNGIAIAHPDKTLVNTNLTKNKDLKDLVSGILSQDKGSRSYNLQGKSKLLIFEKIPTTGYICAITLDKGVIYSSLSTLRINYIIFTIIIAFIAALASYLISRSLSKPIAKLTESSKMMAMGDLTVKTNIKGKDEIAELAIAYNSMAENLRNLIKKIIYVADMVNTKSHNMNNIAEQSGKTSREIFTTVEELAKGAGDQANSVQDGAEMVSDMTKAINEISVNAENSTKMIEQVHKAIDMGYNAVMNQSKLMDDSKSTTKNVSEAIELLEEKSQMIGKIVEVIGGIASQTNLLALNAAIEAARAGEHGKGFAVVADEVRKLAEQSASSSSEITALLKEIQTRTSQSVNEMKLAQEVVQKQEKAVNQTKDYFDQIKQSASEIVSNIYKVSDSASVANNNSGKVSEVIADIAAVAEESAAATEEVVATTQEQVNDIVNISKDSNELVKEANNLLEAIKEFKV